MLKSHKTRSESPDIEVDNIGSLFCNEYSESLPPDDQNVSETSISSNLINANTDTQSPAVILNPEVIPFIPAKKIVPLMDIQFEPFEKLRLSLLSNKNTTSVAKTCSISKSSH